MTCSVFLAVFAPGAMAETPLKILVLEGDGALNYIKAPIGRSPVVEVRDDRGEPVEGAAVNFSLPSIGAGGKFLDGGLSFQRKTDLRGRAEMAPFKPNSAEGRFIIKVTATHGGGSASATVTQTNTLAGGSTLIDRGGGRKKFLVLTGISVGATVAGLLARRDGGSSGAGGGATTISLGGVTVGGPR
jgi:hypothetical protein